MANVIKMAGSKLLFSIAKILLTAVKYPTTFSNEFLQKNWIAIIVDSIITCHKWWLLSEPVLDLKLTYKDLKTGRSMRFLTILEYDAIQANNLLILNSSYQRLWFLYAKYRCNGQKQNLRL